MNRKLASIQRIESLELIENADVIEKARVLGWAVVVKKGEFQVGDLCVFFEVDSVLPDADWSAFLGDHKRLKTRRMRGVLSQGLALPLAILPDSLFEDGTRLHSPEGTAALIGQDVTDILEVTKYEIAESNGATLPWPSLVPKTDEVRIQSFPALLDELRGLPWTATVKLDGTSFTALHTGDEFIVCSRNYRVTSGEHWQAAEALGLEEKLRERPWLALQGELVGPGVQKNRLGLKARTVYFFNAYDVLAGQYLVEDALRDLCAEMGLLVVDAASGGDAFDLSLHTLLEMAKGTYPGTTNRREGIIIRPKTPTYSPTLQLRLSFKVLNNDFLLKDEE